MSSSSSSSSSLSHTYSTELVIREVGALDVPFTILSDFPMAITGATTSHRHIYLMNSKQELIELSLVSDVSLHRYIGMDRSILIEKETPLQNSRIKKLKDSIHSLVDIIRHLIALMGQDQRGLNLNQQDSLLRFIQIFLKEETEVGYEQDLLAALSAASFLFQGVEVQTLEKKKEKEKDEVLASWLDHGMGQGYGVGQFLGFGSTPLEEITYDRLKRLFWDHLSSREVLFVMDGELNTLAQQDERIKKIREDLRSEYMKLGQSTPLEEE